MLPYRPALAQAPPAPAPAPTAPVVVTPPAVGGKTIVDLLKWGVIGFGAGAITGFTAAKLMGRPGTGTGEAVLGGLSGAVASLISKLL